MAKCYFARTAKPCKQFPDIRNTSVDPEPFGTTADRGEVATSAASGCVLPCRPIRSLVIGDRPYIAGLGPVVRIEDIPDLPPEMKAQMITAVQARSARIDRLTAGKCEDKPLILGEARRVEHDEPCSDGVVPDAGADAHPALGKTPPVAGPVFSSSEIAAARRLLAHLDREEEYCLECVTSDPAVYVHPALTNTDVSPGLCRKLARIGVVSVAENPDRINVRRCTKGASLNR
jgi:hypothetical protein